MPLPPPPPVDLSGTEFLATAASSHVEIPKSDGATHKQHRPPSLSPVCCLRSGLIRCAEFPSFFGFVVPLGLHIEIKNKIRWNEFRGLLQIDRRNWRRTRSLLLGW